mgnify:FL=1
MNDEERAAFHARLDARAEAAKLARRGEFAAILRKAIDLNYYDPVGMGPNCNKIGNRTPWMCVALGRMKDNGHINALQLLRVRERIMLRVRESHYRCTSVFEMLHGKDSLNHWQGRDPACWLACLTFFEDWITETTPAPAKVTDVWSENFLGITP